MSVTLSPQLTSPLIPELTPEQVTTLEAVADTMVPGCKRDPDDLAIAGVDATPGAVQAGALHVLTDPATGISDGVGDMADLLNELAVHHLPPTSSAEAGAAAVPPPFVALDYGRRRELLRTLCSPESGSRELWFLVMLFAYMAFDSAPHLATADAVRGGHVGLTAMEFSQPGPDGIWRNPHRSYGRATAAPRPGTDARGNLG